ncbi:MAG TPA: tetratricopeptide repeat protein [Terriglobales bacterium]|jgi:Flp pilus assembly protein TadD|nr:tetratricopeptide repeat protein [Terriglobales bacterium]
MSVLRPSKRRQMLLVVTAAFGMLIPPVHAGDLKITLSKRSRLTPVQRLNQEGVEAVQKHQYEKATALFYKAYLYDPDDPFTLNNLGYIAELDGQVDRAQHFYQLASLQATDAVIARSSSAKLKGEPFKDAVVGVHDQPVQISRANVSAVHLLSQRRGSEAEALLQTALAEDPHNAFTLNNLGVAKEMEGDLESALKYYTEAADAHSSQPVVVTYDRASRGKPVSEMAADSARRLQQRIQTETAQDQAALLNLRGVAAMNRNDWQDANKNFRAAYSLDPNNAFSLNNIGYVAEMTGDPETAQLFYEKARQAQKAGARVDLATSQSVEGMKLFEVSDDNDQKVAAKIIAEAQARRQESGPVELKHRDNTPVIEPTEPGAPAAPQSAPQLTPGSPQSAQPPRS